jgi:hypothetical protein
MSTLMDIIEEEKKRLEKLLLLYTRKIEQLPKGYISKKKIYGHNYCYQAYRDGSTVKTIYIGLDSSDDVKELKEKIDERKKLLTLYKKAKINLDEAKRALRAKR